MPTHDQPAMPLFDTHSHIDQEEFDDDRDGLIERARDAGLSNIVAVGCTAEASARCVGLAEQYDLVHAAVGIQPNYCAEAATGDWDRIVELAGRPGVVAIGETGLDRHWDYTPFDVQQDYFDRHIRLARDRKMPFIVHMRDCDDDIMAMLRDAHRAGPLSGIMHSFTGDTAMASECVALGLHISFAGMVTFKKSQALRDTAATVPENRILIETDSPYLSPHPLRSKRPNEPSYIVHTSECLANVRGVTAEQFADQTAANARELFGLEK
jgi:TatD DNase family protein